ncbi:MAG TPA: hypothetical protein VJP02_18945 [Candidatus Sulfotelmatobacter sp.]|nr:hypothetical protein [Candidatus Sulfotelmatobacter sp.]
MFTDTVGGNPVNANAINDAGEVVGQALFSNQFFHAYLRRKGVATDLGTLPGDCFSEAFAINDRGQVVGQSLSCDFLSGSVFLWDSGSMIDLHAFVPPGSGIQLAEAQAINARGEIAGDLLPPGCTDDTQCGHAFVLILCDDHSNEEGCQEGDEGTATAIQNSPARTNVPTRMIDSGLTPKEIGARIRTRFGRSRGFSRVPPK